MEKDLLDRLRFGDLAPHVHWQPISAKPQHDETPFRCFVWLDGWSYHSDTQWRRDCWGLVDIDRDGPQGFNAEQIFKLKEYGDMEHGEVTFWAPGSINRPNADPEPPECSICRRRHGSEIMHEAE